MTSDTPCIRCGAQPPDSATGPCPGYLIKDTLANHTPPHIGDYDILGLLGVGGGGVYRVKHRSLGRDVALKVIRAGEFATPEERRRFDIEIAAVRDLNHSNIVPIDEVGEHEGRPYYTMKLYDSTLADQLNRYREPAVAAEPLAAA